MKIKFKDLTIKAPNSWYFSGCDISVLTEEVYSLQKKAYCPYKVYINDQEVPFLKISYSVDPNELTIL